MDVFSIVPILWLVFSEPLGVQRCYVPHLKMCVHHYFQQAHRRTGQNSDVDVHIIKKEIKQ